MTAGRGCDIKLSNDDGDTCFANNRERLVAERARGEKHTTPECAANGAVFRA